MAYEYFVKEARVVYADPVKQLYRVALTTDGGALVYAVPAGLRRSKGSTVVNTDTYTIGDIVLVAVGDLTATKVASTTRAVILCIFPGDTGLYNDMEDQHEAIGPAVSYYAEGERVHRHEDQLGKSGFNSADRHSVTSGDLHLHSRNAGISVSEFTAELGSTDAIISTNSLDGSIRTSAVTTEQVTPGVIDKTQIVNETVLKTTRVYGGLNGRYSENFREQTGDLPYGNIRTILNNEGVPLSTVEQRMDGSIRITAATGLTLRRSVNMAAYDDTYTSLLVADPDIEEQGAEPFDRISPSSSWTKASIESYSDKPRPVDRPVPAAVSELELPDATGANTNNTVCAESIISQKPDGSIIIRDAWGSEIRMFNGDIQFSAANKITTIADTDILTMCGGVASLRAGAGIQAVTDFGHIEAASGKEINITATENINVVGDACVNVSSLGDLATVVGGDVILKGSGNLSVTITGDSALSSATCNLMVYYDFSVATPASILRVADMTIDVSAYRFNIHSDVEISDKQYTSGDFPGGFKVAPSQGSGGLRVGGTVVTDAGIVVNGYAIVKSSINAAQVNALSVADDTGVYKIKSMPKVDTATAEHKSESRFNKKNMTETTNKSNKAGAVSFLSRMFEALFSVTKGTKNVIAIFKPKYTEGDTSRNIVAPPTHHVASTGQAVYIYPGRDFWEGACVYAPDKEDNIDTGSKKSQISSITTIAKEDIYYAGK